MTPNAVCDKCKKITRPLKPTSAIHASSRLCSVACVSSRTHTESRIIGRIIARRATKALKKENRPYHPTSDKGRYVNFRAPVEKGRPGLPRTASAL